jgi:hypothetical protein
MNPLQHLTELDYAAKRAAHPTMPYPVKTKFSDKTANDLTRAIVRTFQLHGHFATRLQSTGQYRDDLSQWVASQQRAGMPDVSATVRGRSVYVEVKHGADRLSAQQRDTIAALEQSEAMVYVARDFAGFWQWFQASFPAPARP